MTDVVDNCLPQSWAGFLRQRGHSAVHWREIGLPDAPDTEIMRWAREHEAIVLTQDLDFTKLLFQSGAVLPSLIQLRLDDVRPTAIGDAVVLILEKHAEDLACGAVLSVGSRKARCRVLPLRE